MSEKKSEFKNLTAVVLAGGFGTRLQSVKPNQQKVVVDVLDKPFLTYILDQLVEAGIKKAVLCTGHLGKQVKAKLGLNYRGLKLFYSEEKYKLGTAGALKNALPFLDSEELLVLNGDSYCKADLKKFLLWHHKKRAKVSIVLVETSDSGRFGQVKLDKKKAVVSFEEKGRRKKKGLVNAGIYIISRELISEIPEKTEISLEKQIFPKWVGNNFFGFETKAGFIDIGTPESYFESQKFFKTQKNKVKRFVLLDRDGTLIHERNYLSKPEQVELLPQTPDGLRILKGLGLGLVVVTNQSGLGRGYFNFSDLELVHGKLDSLLLAEGIELDGIFFCPHVPEDSCLCRKPKPGLVKKASKKHNFDPKLSFVIGDKPADIKLGQKIGAVTFLVRTGYGADFEKEGKLKPDFVVDDLKKAAEMIKKLI